MKSIDNNHREEAEETSYNWIAIGYFFAVIGGIIGVLIGWHIWTSKNDEDESETYLYSDHDRKHGLGILILGLASMIIWISMNFVYFSWR